MSFLFIFLRQCCSLFLGCLRGDVVLQNGSANFQIFEVLLMKDVIWLEVFDLEKNDIK